MRHVTLVVKATRLCNLRCVYCHDWRAGPGHRMTFDVMARTTHAALRDEEHAFVTFVWHGGESTTLPRDFFAKALTVQERFRRPRQLVRNVLQTNATRLDDAWGRFLKAGGFEVGVSIDGPPELHDLKRRYASGRASFDHVLRGLDVLRRHDVPHHVLMVVDEDTLALGADRVFDFLVEHDIRRFGINAVAPVNQPDAAPGTPTDGYLEPQRVAPFLARLYDRWREHGDRGIRIRELEGLEARVGGGASTYCRLRGACLGDYFIVEPDGGVAHCDLFLGDPAYELGDVRTTTFAEMRTSAAMRALQTKRARELEQMSSCERFGVCQGWCPHERYLSARHNAEHDDTCCGLRELIDHVAAAQHVELVA